METNYSLSDIVAAMGNGGLGGGNNILLVIILLFALGGGIGGYRNGDYGQFATAASQQEILFGQQFQNLDNKIDRLGYGVADATYALNEKANTVQTVLGGAIVDEARRSQEQISNLKYDMANQFAHSNAKTTAEIQQVKDLIKDNKIETLQGRINQLELQNAMCGVVRYPSGLTYNAGASPFCGCNNNCCM